MVEINPGTESPVFLYFSNDAATKLELVSPSNPLPVNASVTPTGTQNVNVTQIGGNAVSTGTGASGTGTIRVVTSTDSTIGVEGADGSTQASITNPFPIEPGTGTTFTVVQSTAANLNATVTASSLPLPTGASTSANQPTNAAQGSTTSGQTGTLSEVATLSSAPTYTNAQTNPINGGVRGGIIMNIDGVAVTSLSSQAAFAPYDRGGSARAPAVAPFLYDGTNADVARSIQGADQTGLGITAVAQSPNTSANSAPLHTQTSTVASNLVVKSGAGNLYGLNVDSGASALYVMVFDATSAPADGTVTPVKVYQLGLNSSFNIAPTSVPLLHFATGCTIVASTTGPFTKTNSSTAFISGDYE